MRQPFREGGDAGFHEFSLQPSPAQRGAHVQRSMTIGRMVADEIIHVAAIIEQVLIEKPPDDAGNDASVVALVNQFSPEFLGSMIPTRERVECEHSGSAGVRGIDRIARQASGLLGFTAAVHRRLLGNELGPHLRFDVLGDLRMLLQEGPRIVLALTNTLTLVAVPRPGFFH